MAFDIFMKIKGIEGESQDGKHKNEVDVLAWSWGVSQAGSFGGGGGGGAGKVNVQDLSFTKYIDKSSPDLLLHCCSGKHIPETILVCRKAGGDAPLEYLTIKLTDVLVTSVSTGGSGSEDRLTENVSLNFAKVQVDYKEQTATGGIGATPKMGWDIKKNEKV